MKAYAFPLLLALALAGCVSSEAGKGASGPYKMTDRSLPVPEATTAAYKAKDGKTYRITTYVEAFTPGYYMVVGSADGTDSAQSYDAIAKAGVEYLRKYDCKAGFSHYRNRETYDAQSKSWLIAGECAVS